MTSAGRPARDGATIGAVLARLRPEFPDITISKIRFLEAEGLISPDRTPSGYRRFTDADISRLRYVLATQRDHYLPLKVIKEQLDRGEAPPPLAAVPRSPRALARVPEAAAQAGTAVRAQARVSPARLTREDVVDHSAADAALVAELEQFGLLRPGPGGFYDADAVQVVRIATALAGHGIEPRHLRAFRAAADRELDLLEQVVAPIYRQRDPSARGRADELARELAGLSVGLHTLLVKSGLRRVTGQ